MSFSLKSASLRKQPLHLSESDKLRDLHAEEPVFKAGAKQRRVMSEDECVTTHVRVSRCVAQVEQW